MRDVALEIAKVYKKFRRGERHDSLRDLLPALAKGALRRAVGAGELKAQEFWALRDVSCVVRRGEAVGIIGHNGAGKSTLLKLLSGVMRPTSGAIAVNGRLSALIEVGAGFHQDLTGRENVVLNGVIMGMSRDEVRRKFDEIVEFAGLADFIDTPVKRYSSGMYARLGFSVAAHLEPDILVVDEVLSVGDFLFQAKSIEKMRSVVKCGATVIFVSHNLRAMADLCSRALLLNRGCLVEDGPTSRVIHTYMDQQQVGRIDADDKQVIIESVAVRGTDGARFDFEAGEKAVVKVVVRAQKTTERVSCVLYILDDNFYKVFEISSERLEKRSRDFAPGDLFEYEFALSLHLAAGNYQLCVVLYRHDLGIVYDKLEPVATLLMNNAVEIRGIANLYPSVTSGPADDRAGRVG